MNPMYLRDEDPGDEDPVSPEVQEAQDEELDTDFCPRCDKGLLEQVGSSMAWKCDRCGYFEET